MRTKHLAAIFLVLWAALGLSMLAAADTRRVYLPLVSDPRTPGPLAGETATSTATATTAPSTTSTTAPNATSTATATTAPSTTSTAISTTAPTATSTGTPAPSGPCLAIYPIGVESSTIEGDAFRNPGDVDPVDGVPDDGWRVIEAGPYAGRTARRLTSGSYPDTFAFLRWNKSVSADGFAATSSRALEASLRYPGNLARGFEEAPWPDPATAPTEYPTNPGQLNVGDWVWGVYGYSISVNTVLEAHVTNQYGLLLPIYDQSFGMSSNTEHRVVNFAEFRLLSFGSQQGELYLELVLLGEGAGRPLCPPPA